MSRAHLTPKSGKQKFLCACFTAFIKNLPSEELRNPVERGIFLHHGVTAPLRVLPFVCVCFACRRNGSGWEVSATLTHRQSHKRRSVSLKKSITLRPTFDVTPYVSLRVSPTRDPPTCRNATGSDGYEQKEATDSGARRAQFRPLQVATTDGCRPVDVRRRKLRGVLLAGTVLRSVLWS